MSMSEAEQVSFYESKLDSIFKRQTYRVVSKNFKTFIPKADYPFMFKVHPVNTSSK